MSNFLKSLQYSLLLEKHPHAKSNKEGLEVFHNGLRLQLLLKGNILSLKGVQKFEEVQTYVIFLGYARSGGSLMGSLLDAHPNAIISHEMDAIGLLQHRWFNRENVFPLLLKNSEEFAKYKRTWSRYSYYVPNQFQGKFKNLQIIGDKQGGKSTERLGENLRLIEVLRKKLNVRLKFIHHQRNPFDMLSTSSRNFKQDPVQDYLIEYHFKQCRHIKEIRDLVPKEDYLCGYHEQMIKDPKAHLKKLCDFLSLECSDQELQDCKSIIFESPNKSRHKSTWNNKLIAKVQNRIDQFDFLRGYNYES